MAQLLSESRPPATLKSRLIGIASGVMLAAIGYWYTAHGIYTWRHWNGQPVFSWSGVAAGFVVIVVSCAPAWMIVKMTAIKNYQPYHTGRAAHPVNPAKVAEMHAKKGNA